MVFFDLEIFRFLDVVRNIGLNTFCGQLYCLLDFLRFLIHTVVVFQVFEFDLRGKPWCGLVELRYCRMRGYYFQEVLVLICLLGLHLKVLNVISPIHR